MPKLKKEKFTLSASVKERTTFTGDIELYLYYNTEHNYFYFDEHEIKNAIKLENRLSFGHCDTRDKALDVIKLLIKENIVWERKFRLRLIVDKSLIEDKNEVIKRLCDRMSYSKNQFGLEFNRLEYTTFNGRKYYRECNQKWQPSTSINYGEYDLTIDYSEETEAFLLSMQKQIEDVSKRAIDFFSEETEQKLFDKIQVQSKKLIAF
jgi:hypothetical protein